MFEALLGNNHNKLIIEQPPIDEDQIVNAVRYGKVVGQENDLFGLNMDMDKTGDNLAVFSARYGGTVHYLKRQNNNYVEKQVLTIGSMNTALKASGSTYKEQFTISPDGSVLVILKNQARPASILIYKKNQQGLWDYTQEITGMKTKDMSCCDTSEDGTWLFVSSLTQKVFVFKMGADGKYVKHQDVSKAGIGRKVYCSDNGDTIIATNSDGVTGATYNLHVFRKDQNGVFVNTQSLRGLTDGLSRSIFIFGGIKISGDGSTIIGGDSGVNSVHIFKLNQQTNNYYLFKTIVSNSTEGEQSFGANIDISYSGNTVIVGDPGLYPGEARGSYPKTYVYKLINGNYMQTNVLTSDDPRGNDEQGKVVRISRDSRRCVASASREKVDVAIHGAIYSFGV